MSFDANLVLKQLGFSTSRLSIMIGAKNFARDDDKKYVSFRFTAKARNKANYCKVTLDDSDTYTVEFGRVHGFKYTVKSTNSMVYCDRLTSLFESETGLALSM